MKHATRNNILGVCIVAAIALGAYVLFSIFVYTGGIEHRAGVMRHIDRVEDDFWGLETKKKIFGVPLMTERYRLEDTPIIYELPEEFKIDGLPVKVSFRILDVIGMSDWDVVIVPVEITAISE